MPTEKITSSIKTIEMEAEKLLQEARNRANEILRKANDEANNIISMQMPLDEVKAEYQEIINKAKEEAGREGEESGKKASGIKALASEKIDHLARRIVDIVVGVKRR